MVSQSGLRLRHISGTHFKEFEDGEFDAVVAFHHEEGVIIDGWCARPIHGQSTSVTHQGPVCNPNRLTQAIISIFLFFLISRISYNSHHKS